MRPNVKARWIHATLLNRIRCGPPEASMRLPSERKLAEEFGAARSTVRQALEFLEADGLIQRQRKHGTWSVAQSGASGKTITFLLACRTLERSGVMWYLVREMVQDLQRECRETGCMLELIPVSPSNDPHDIDDALLAHLGPSSRVIVYGDWFMPLMPRLIRTGARILFIRMHDFRLEKVRKWYLEAPPNVSFLTPDIEMLYYRAVARLADCGCRRIACLAPLHYARNTQIQQGYRKGLAAFCDSEPLLLDSGRVFERVTTFEELGRFLHGWHKKTKFDGLLYSADLQHLCEEYRIFNHDTMRLPETVKVVMTHLVPYQAARNPAFPVIQFEHRIPPVAVRLLLHPAEIPKIRVLEPDWCA